MDNEEKYKKLIRAIKVLRDLKPHDECLENWIKENAPEIAESEDERIRKELIDIVKKSPITFAFEDKGKVLAWLEKQDPKKHQEELDAAYKTADKVQYHRGYEAAWKEMGEQPPMQNGITINGVEYELIEDREDDECERCALSDICHDARKEVICNPIFGDLSISHRFEKRKL
jgi:hypothetical protein